RDVVRDDVAGVHAAPLDLAEEALRLRDDDALRPRDHDDAAALRAQRLLDGVQRARGAQELLAERAGRDELAVAEEDAHEFVHPLARGLREVDEAEEVAGRRGVADGVGGVDGEERDLLALGELQRDRGGARGLADAALAGEDKERRRPDGWLRAVSARGRRDAAGPAGEDAGAPLLNRLCGVEWRA